MKRLVRKLIPKRLLKKIDACVVRRRKKKELINCGVLNTLQFLNEQQKCNFKKILNSNSFWSENRLYGGTEYPDKTFYIIRRIDSAGLFSIFISVLGQIKVAIDNGYIPVVDMMDYPNNYLEQSLIGKRNSWEYYFEQPCGYDLKEAYSGMNLILCEAHLYQEYPDDTLDFLYDTDGRLSFWKEIAKKYINIKPEMLQSIEKEYEKLIKKGDRVLGILARGTDYVALRPPQHPVPPDVDMIMADADHIFTEKACNKVFVATEDKKIAEILKKHYAKAYLTNKREFVDYQGGYICETSINRENDKYLQGKEYLTTIYILSKCNCIIAARASGTVAADIMSQGWEYAKYYDLGVFPGEYELDDEELLSGKV